jgi:hypothetical protein
MPVTSPNFARLLLKRSAGAFIAAMRLLIASSPALALS